MREKHSKVRCLLVEKSISELTLRCINNYLLKLLGDSNLSNLTPVYRVYNLYLVARGWQDGGLKKQRER